MPQPVRSKKRNITETTRTDMPSGQKRSSGPACQTRAYSQQNSDWKTADKFDTLLFDKKSTYHTRRIHWLRSGHPQWPQNVIDVLSSTFSWKRQVAKLLIHWISGQPDAVSGEEVLCVVCYVLCGVCCVLCVAKNSK